jgi:hypothetical protein
MDKKCGIYTIECYSAIKKNEIMSFTEKLMELENMLCEISQDEKDKYHVFTHMQNPDDR